MTNCPHRALFCLGDIILFWVKYSALALQKKDFNTLRSTYTKSGEKIVKN